MKTFRTEVKNFLVNNGISERHINSIIEIAQNHEDLECMNGRWDNDISDYPNNMIVIFLVSIEKIAKEWLCKNTHCGC